MQQQPPARSYGKGNLAGAKKPSQTSLHCSTSAANSRSASPDNDLWFPGAAAPLSRQNSGDDETLNSNSQKENADNRSLRRNRGDCDSVLCGDKDAKKPKEAKDIKSFFESAAPADIELIASYLEEPAYKDFYQSTLKVPLSSIPSGKAAQVRRNLIVLGFTYQSIGDYYALSFENQTKLKKALSTFRSSTAFRETVSRTAADQSLGNSYSSSCPSSCPSPQPHMRMPVGSGIGTAPGRTLSTSYDSFSGSSNASQPLASLTSLAFPTQPSAPAITATSGITSVTPFVSVVNPTSSLSLKIPQPTQGQAQAAFDSLMSPELRVHKQTPSGARSAGKAQRVQIPPLRSFSSSPRSNGKRHFQLVESEDDCSPRTEHASPFTVVESSQGDDAYGVDSGRLYTQSPTVQLADTFSGLNVQSLSAKRSNTLPLPYSNHPSCDSLSELGGKVQCEDPSRNLSSPFVPMGGTGITRIPDGGISFNPPVCLSSRSHSSKDRKPEGDFTGIFGEQVPSNSINGKDDMNLSSDNGETVSSSELDLERELGEPQESSREHEHDISLTLSAEDSLFPQVSAGSDQLEDEVQSKIHWPESELSIVDGCSGKSQWSNYASVHIGLDIDDMHGMSGEEVGPRFSSSAASNLGTGIEKKKQHLWRDTLSEQSDKEGHWRDSLPDNDVVERKNVGSKALYMPSSLFCDDSDDKSFEVSPRKLGEAIATRHFDSERMIGAKSSANMLSFPLGQSITSSFGEFHLDFRRSSGSASGSQPKLRRSQSVPQIDHYRNTDDLKSPGVPMLMHSISLSQPNPSSKPFETPQNTRNCIISPDKDWALSRHCVAADIQRLINLYQPNDQVWAIDEAVLVPDCPNSLVSRLGASVIVASAQLMVSAGRGLSASRDSTSLRCRQTSTLITTASPITKILEEDQEDQEDISIDLNEPMEEDSMPRQSRQEIRNKRSEAKWKRMSFHPNKSKVCMSLNSSSTTLVGLNITSDAHNSSILGIGAASPIALPKTPRLTKQIRLSHSTTHTGFLKDTDFRGTIIGGTYQMCFDGSRPVVAPPTSNEKRIVKTFILFNGAIELHLAIPGDKRHKEILLSSGWFCARASPIGYLIGKEPFSAKRSIYYFVQKDPRTSTTNSTSYSMQVESEGELTSDESSISKIIDANNEMSASTTSDDIQQALTFQSVDWNNSSIMLCVLSLSFLSDRDLSNSRSVCKSWAIAGYGVLSQRLSTQSEHAFEWHQWSQFLSRHNWGKFLSRGACKEVYCVTSFRADTSTTERIKHGNRGSPPQLQAVSVINIDEMEERGVVEIIQKELEISMMCSSLVSLKVCPFLLEIYSAFRSSLPAPSSNSIILNHKPQPSLWDKSFPAPVVPTNEAIPTAKTMKRYSGDFQFIRMEFCTGGDLEDLLRDVQLISVETVRHMLFQMLYAMYCCRDLFAMRHYDIKLLNFFVTAGMSLLPDGGRELTPTQVELIKTMKLRIGFEQEMYELSIGLQMPELVKLADFGTGVIGQRSLGDLITVQQFTTLENTPPEYLLLGSAARQAYTADTFCLGLCYLHLLTGYKPYEELLADVLCPEYLMHKLTVLWEPRRRDPANDFYIITEVIESLDDSEDDPNRPDLGCKKILYHTLYRYLVLFGLAEFEDQSSLRPLELSAAHTYAGSAVYDVVKEALTNRAFKKQFDKDTSVWSVRSGAHDIMISLRERLQLLGSGAQDLLFAMVNLDPSKRCSMYEALTGEVFQSLRVMNSGNNSSLSSMSQLSSQSQSLCHSQESGSVKSNSSANRLAKTQPHGHGQPAVASGSSKHANAISPVLSYMHYSTAFDAASNFDYERHLSHV